MRRKKKRKTPATGAIITWEVAVSREVVADISRTEYFRETVAPALIQEFKDYHAACRHIFHIKKIARSAVIGTLGKNATLANIKVSCLTGIKGFIHYSLQLCFVFSTDSSHF
jgi:hypothetical protein